MVMVTVVLPIQEEIEEDGRISLGQANFEQAKRHLNPRASVG